MYLVPAWAYVFVVGRIGLISEGAIVYIRRGQLVPRLIELHNHKHTRVMVMFPFPNNAGINSV